MASRFASPKYYCETRASRKVVIPGPHLLWAVYMQRSYGPFGLLHKPPPDSRYAVSAYLVGCISPLARPNLCNLDPLAWLAGNAGFELLHGARLGLVWGQLLVTSSFAHRCSPTSAPPPAWASSGNGEADDAVIRREARRSWRRVAVAAVAATRRRI